MRFPVIVPGSESWNDWRQYFEVHLRWTPVTFYKLLHNAPDKPREGFTVPTLYPQHFDPDFVANDRWQPPATRYIDRLSHETILQLHAKYGPTWGLRVIGHARKPPPPSITNEELRRLYSKKPVEDGDTAG